MFNLLIMYIMKVSVQIFLLHCINPKNDTVPQCLLTLFYCYIDFYIWILLWCIVQFDDPSFNKCL